MARTFIATAEKIHRDHADLPGFLARFARARGPQAHAEAGSR